MVLKLSNEELENKEKMYESFIIFEPNNDKTLPSKNKIDNYIILDILDEERNLVFKNITMNKFYSTHHVENLYGDNNYYIIIKGGIYQFGYVMQIYSEGHKIENMTYENYLIQTLKYQLTTINIEHPLIDNENFYLLSKLKIIPAVDEEGNQLCQNDELGDIKIIFNVKYPIKHLKPFIKIFVQEDNNNLKGKEIYSNEEIFLPQGNYVVTIFFKNLSYPVLENTCDIDIVYSNPNYSIQQLEIIEPYIISDEYIPNRHNTIFKELIFSPEKIYCSLGIELVSKHNIIEEGNKVIQEEKSLENSEISDKLNDKIKLVLDVYHLTDENDEGGNLPLDNNNKKIPGSEGQEEPEQIPSPFPYLLICHIESGFDVKNSIANDKLTWTIKVFSSDKVSFVKELSKEDKEKSLKNNWEENEPGRAEKAMISRKKFCIEKTKKEGGTLTMEQLEFLNQKNDKKENTTNKRVSVSKKRKSKLSIVAVNKKIEEKKEENRKDKLIIKKPLPKSIDHKSKYIKNYLDYAYKKRTRKINTHILDQYLKTINNNEVLEAKNKKIEKTMKDFDELIKTEMTNTFYKDKGVDSSRKEEILSTFYKSDMDNRLLESNKLNQLINNRDKLKNQFKQKIDAKNTLSDIIKNYNIYSYEFSYMMESYKNTVQILGENYPDNEKVYKILINYKEDEIKRLINKYTNRERNNALKIIEEIESNNLKVSEDLIKKLKELMG